MTDFEIALTGFILLFSQIAIIAFCLNFEKIRNWLENKGF
jgi:hypothetical protein